MLCGGLGQASPPGRSGALYVAIVVTRMLTFLHILVQSIPDASINISVAVCSTRCILLVTSTYLISSFLLAEGQTIVSS
jgi:hypothetical protein